PEQSQARSRGPVHPLAQPDALVANLEGHPARHRIRKTEQCGPAEEIDGEKNYIFYPRLAATRWDHVRPYETSSDRTCDKFTACLGSMPSFAIQTQKNFIF